MAYEELKEDVWRANMGLFEAGLVALTWGNASGVDRQAGVMAIKPSGVDYEDMRAEDMVVLDIKTGKNIEGKLNPSSDTASHLVLYQEFPAIGGVIHTHSNYATSFAQAGKEIPALGTTHADNFYSAVPVTRMLTEQEIKNDYELNTGKLIAEHFKARNLDVMSIPAVLVPYHGPFTWGKDPKKALENAIVLEEIARMAFQTRLINPTVASIPRELLDKHFLRKHGPGAYYGQK